MSRFAFPRLFAFILLAAVVAIPSASARAKAPDWLTAVASRPASLDYGDAKYVVLLDESSIEVGRNGLLTERYRYAVRVLTQDGKSAAIARAGYESGSEKVKSFQAWHLPAQGQPALYAKKDTIDTVPYSDGRDLYKESRLLLISASNDVAIGSVFGYESVIESRTIFSQSTWFFNTSMPVEESTVRYHVPPGWSVRAQTFNHDAIAPIVSGDTYTWSLKSIPAVADDAGSPGVRDFVPWLGLDIVPSTADAAGCGFQPLATWKDVSVFQTAYYDPPSIPDDSIKARAAAVVGDARTTWERITRLCREAQRINYIAIAINLNQAGGYTPRPAPRVLQCNYGDCKDKATLLRSLLLAQGITSYPVAVYSGAATFVRPEWPSPFQFNHCILAIPVDDTVDVPAIVVHPTLGRLLIFDPTNEYLAPGWLPMEDLAGYALVLAGEKGALVAMPPLVNKNNHVKRTIAAQLAGDGTVSGHIREESFGLASVDQRAVLINRSKSDYQNKYIEPRLARTLPAVRVIDLKTHDDFDRATFTLDLDFSAGTYAKNMRGTLLIFKPVMIQRRDSIPLKKGKRANPYVIYPQSFEERAEIHLPDGFEIDELVKPVLVDSPFGHYATTVELRPDRTLVFERQFTCDGAIVPAKDFDVARAFFEKILQAEKSPVVLKHL